MEGEGVCGCVCGCVWGGGRVTYVSTSLPSSFLHSFHLSLPPSLPVILLSEDDELCGKLNAKDICTETISQAERDPSCPVKILPSRYLTKIYNHLGESHCVMSHDATSHGTSFPSPSGMNKKMKLSGRFVPASAVCTVSSLNVHASLLPPPLPPPPPLSSSSSSFLLLLLFPPLQTAICSGGDWYKSTVQHSLECHAGLHTTGITNKCA